MSKKQAYKDKMEAQLDEFDAELDKLKAKADKADASARVEYHKEVDDLRARKRAIREKLRELENSSDEAWQDVKAGVESAWDSLSEAARSARSRFD